MHLNDRFKYYFEFYFNYILFLEKYIEKHTDRYHKPDIMKEYIQYEIDTIRNQGKKTYFK